MSPMKQLTLPLLLLGALLASCASQPATAPPIAPPPAGWQASDAGASNPNWAGLADPQLSALQAKALQANRDIAQAALRWQLAQTQAQLVGLRVRPSLELNSSASRSLEQPRSVLGWARSNGANTRAGYELDLWGRLAASESAQAAQAEAVGTDIAAAEQLIRSRVAEAYWTLGAIAQQRPLAQQQLAINQLVLEAVSLRAREGKLLPIEIDNAAGNVQQAQVRLANLAADAELQRYQLALLLDQALPGPALSEPRLPAQIPPRWAPGLPAELLERRPDVQRARLQVDAALARSRAAHAERYPSLSFSAGLGTGGAKLGDLLSNPAVNLAANLAVPLIDWRRLDQQDKSARTELALSALALRDAVQTALVEVESQLIESERLQQQISANAQRLQEAREAEGLAQLRLQVGAISRIDALQAQSARLDAEQSHIQLQLRAWLNRAALARTLAI
jgi:NodT family efflux transporter outer membrane factor (OMF) lipoprotein